MSVLRDKKILLAVTGGIAAYKTTYLVRELIKLGANVRVIMTPEATNFITPLTLATLSKNPVAHKFVKDEGEWNNHVNLGLWADLMIIAPLTAKTLSCMAHGHCDNLVLATYLSARCPVIVAPAMDLDMYQHPTTQQNLATIQNNGDYVIPAACGELASGLSGQGRMEEPINIVAYIQDFLGREKLLKGKKVLISAGPTFEAIDPVRYIGNHSSGKMGLELAKHADQMGAEVTLVLGPSKIDTTNYDFNRIDVVSAQNMMDEIVPKFADQDIVIMAAAVADYRPAHSSDQKIKKDTDEMTINLVKNPDILKHLGTIKDKQFLVGFALETNNAIENASKKLKSKNADMIVLNTLEDEGAGFGNDTNKVTFITPDQKPESFSLKSKSDVAKDILTFITQKVKTNA